jgi:acetylornithine deacetylase
MGPCENYTKVKSEDDVKNFLFSRTLIATGLLKMKLSYFSTLLSLSCWTTAADSINAQSPIEDVTNPAPSSSSSSDSPLLSLHKSLIEHESISGNEHNASQFLVTYLKSKNFTVETQACTAYPDLKTPRENVFAYLGKTRKTRTLVSSHIDTVPPFWKYERLGEDIWGRGSVDAKGSVATQIIAVEELLAAGEIEEGDVGLLYVVGEEVGGDGMKTANELGLQWETVIFGEPTELKLASGHKGIMSVEIRAKGKAGHSGYPELGKSANAMIIPALYALQQMKLPYSEKYGNTTLNIGLIEGGVAANVIAEDAVAKIAIRIADGEPAAIEEIILDTLKKTGQELDVKFGGGYGPVYIDSDVPGVYCVEMLCADSLHSIGFENIVVNYGTDIPNLKGDHKRYLYGPGTILMAHSDHEHLKVSDLETAVEGYKALIKHSLK